MAVLSLALPTSLARRDATGLPLLAGVDVPRGGVVELAAPNGLARTTQLALSACATAQRLSRAISHDGDSRWCGWVDARGTLYAPAVAEAGVELSRLLVVRPEPEELAKVAVRMATSRLFSVLVVDRVGVPGASLPATKTRWDIAVRKLALACESSDTTVLLLSDETVAQREALPVAMRLELTRPDHAQMQLRVVKDRRGVTSGARMISLVKREHPSTHGTHPGVKRASP